MILYRIIRKSDSKVFISESYTTKGGTWGRDGVLFKKTSTIAEHLDNLCHDWQWRNSSWTNYMGKTCYHGRWVRIEGSYDVSRLDSYLVEKLTILASKADRLDASDFVENCKPTERECA